MKKDYVIYKVTNRINGKLYIGKTYDFEKRKREHFYDINDNTPFHRALRKYGAENFDWEIIDRADNDGDLKAKEIEWIRKLNTCVHFKNSNGYNITIGGEGGVSWNSRPVVQFNKNGEYINEYASLSDADREVGVYDGCAQMGCDTKGLCGGFLWRRKEDWDGKPLTPYMRKSEKRKPIIQLSLEGKFINRFNSVTEAAKSVKIGRTNISSCLIKHTNTCAGYIWIYESEYDRNKDYSYKGICNLGSGVYQLDNDKKIIKQYNNCSEAAKGIGKEKKNHKMIHRAIQKGYKTYGYYWAKVDDYNKNLSC